MKILTIIPAKLDSTRLSQKNIQKINDKTLVEHAIAYARKSKYKPEIIISSESDLVEEIANKNKVMFSKRDKSMCGDTEVVDVYLQLVKQLDKKYDLIVCLQPDNPDREHTFDYCVDYLIDNNYDDLITISPNFKRSGSVRIFKYEHLINEHVSKKIGCIRDTATDIHYKEDLKKVQEKLQPIENILGKYGTYR